MNQDNIIKDLFLGDSEVVSFVTPLEMDEINKQAIPDDIPVLPLRNTVMFPGIVLPISIGREKSLQLVQDAVKSDSMIAVFSQRNDQQDNPSYDDLFPVGVVSKILKMFRLPDGGTTAILQGVRLCYLDKVTQTEPYMRGFAMGLDTNDGDEKVLNSDVFLATISSLSDVTAK